MVESNSMRFHTPSAFKTESSPAELTFHNLVPNSEFESLTYRLSSECSTAELIGNNLVPRVGLEPTTPSASNWCST